VSDEVQARVPAERAPGGEGAGIAEQIADTLLWEGYALYPYRATAIKNLYRFQFGILASPAEVGRGGGGQTDTMRTECVAGPATAVVSVKVRFLRGTARSVERLVPASDGAERYEAVSRLVVARRVHQPWLEVEPRVLALPPLSLARLAAAPWRAVFSLPAREWQEAIIDPEGAEVGWLCRRQRAVEGRIELTAEAREGGWHRLAVEVRNSSPGEVGERREEALLASMVSTHTVLSLVGGGFVSMVDPPPALRSLVAECVNRGTWPVLVGEPGRRDQMLSSPVILEEYPQVAPESPGDLFDGTEIDELLTLRILTLADDERLEMACLDPRLAEVLERTRALGSEALLGLHGRLQLRSRGAV
jgi:hypothetical protein